MNQQECKDQTARKKGFSDWKDLLKFQFVKLIARDQDEAAKLYASEKVKEALKLAAEKVTLNIRRHNEQILKGNYAYFADDMDHVEVDKSSILSLETELLTKIEEE